MREIWEGFGERSNNWTGETTTIIEVQVRQIGIQACECYKCRRRQVYTTLRMKKEQDVLLAY